jgi:hypothetical protein
MRQTILLSAGLLLPGALAAQAQPLVGSWAVTVPAGMRMENGVATPMQATGALTVRVEGDSLIGTLKMEPIEDAPDRPATRLTAKFATGGAVVFISRSVASNGQGETATLISTYSLEATGDTLKGSVTRKFEEFETLGGGPQPISGKRVK